MITDKEEGITNVHVLLVVITSCRDFRSTYRKKLAGKEEQNYKTFG
jgi:hypothetical protein